MPFFWGFLAGAASTGALVGARKIYQAYQCPSYLDVSGPHSVSYKRRIDYDPKDTYTQLSQKLQQAFPEAMRKRVLYYESDGWNFRTHELREQQYRYFQERVHAGHVSQVSIIE